MFWCKIRNLKKIRQIKKLSKFRLSGQTKVMSLTQQYNMNLDWGMVGGCVI